MMVSEWSSSFMNGVRVEDPFQEDPQMKMYEEEWFVLGTIFFICHPDIKWILKSFSLSHLTEYYWFDYPAKRF